MKHRLAAAPPSPSLPPSTHRAGFFTEKEPPLLPASDLPTYAADNPYAPTPPGDGAFYGTGGSHNTAAERSRLHKLLDFMPTSVAQDEALLAAKKWLGLAMAMPDWRERLAVRFRIARKKALRRAIDAIDAALEVEGGAPRGPEARTEL
jgi:hypothetical protein